jgi:hypothetical protein
VVAVELDKAIFEYQPFKGPVLKTYFSRLIISLRLVHCLTNKLSTMVASCQQTMCIACLSLQKLCSKNISIGSSG